MQNSTDRHQRGPVGPGDRHLRCGAFAKKREIDIELATDRQAYLPGEAATAFARLVPHEALEGVECSVAPAHIDRYPFGDGSCTDDRAVPASTS